MSSIELTKKHGRIHFVAMSEMQTISLGDGYATSILYRDELMLIAVKPSGLPVHETKDSKRPDFTRMLEKSLNISHLRCANRLDLMTTGIVVFGLDPGRNLELDELLKKSKKFYLVVTEGIIDESEFKIESFLKDGKGRAHTVRSGGKKAITRFKVLKRFPDSTRTLLEAELVTGRRHQIRVHLAEKGFSIVGDSVYGKITSRQKKMYLHAWKIVLPEEYSIKEIISKPEWMKSYS